MTMIDAASPIAVTLEPDADGEVRSIILNGLRMFNRQRAEAPDFQPLVLAARAGDTVIGGLVGETGWKWLYVDLLWVSDPYRGRGLGRHLLEAAEMEAMARGARHAYLDTFDFQARPFYEKQGYQLFGMLEDYPPGHTRFYLRKDLSRS
ncbi:MAG TPA: GNAT family N-acetyltransferase [Longimicrobiales bacterium]